MIKDPLPHYSELRRGSVPYYFVQLNYQFLTACISSSEKDVQPELTKLSLLYKLFCSTDEKEDYDAFRKQFNGLLFYQNIRDNIEHKNKIKRLKQELYKELP